MGLKRAYGSCSAEISGRGAHAVTCAAPHEDAESLEDEREEASAYGPLPLGSAAPQSVVSRCSSLVSVALFGTALGVLGLIFGATQNAQAPPVAAARITEGQLLASPPMLLPLAQQHSTAEEAIAAAAAIPEAAAAAAAAASQARIAVADERRSAGGSLPAHGGGNVFAQQGAAEAASVPVAVVAVVAASDATAAPAAAATRTAAAAAAAADDKDATGSNGGSHGVRDGGGGIRGARGGTIGGDQPNMVFILIDDMGFNDIGYQSTDLKGLTPNLDALAANGVKLKNYYSSYLCTPARATLMTGRNPYRYGLQYSVILPAAPYGLSLKESILPQYLNGAGYRSHMVGKWHLGSFQEDYLPHRRGFETFLGYLDDEEDYYTHKGWSVTAGGRGFRDFGYADKDAGYIDPLTNMPFGSFAAVGQYSTDIFTQRAIDVATAHASDTPDQPLFLYLAYQAVHDPLGPPPADSFSDAELAAIDALNVKDKLRKRFAEVVMYLDKQIGRLASTLEDLGYMDNTLIVVASDNGACPMYGGSNYPLRGIKHSYWEGGSKVPAFVYGPGVLPDAAAGTESSALFSVADWVPTLTGLAGASLDPPGLLLHGEADDADGAASYDGVDQWGALTGEVEPPRDFLVYNFDIYQQGASRSDPVREAPPKGAIRVGKWKLIVQDWCTGYYSFGNDDKYPEDMCGEIGACWLCGGTCVNEPTIKPASYLFNLETDPVERYNLISRHPDIARRLRKQWLLTSLADHEPTHHKTQMASPAELIWEHHNDCIVPWWDIFQSHNATTLPDVGGDHLRPSGGDAAHHMASKDAASVVIPDRGSFSAKADSGKSAAAAISKSSTSAPTGGDNTTSPSFPSPESADRGAASSSSSSSSLRPRRSGDSEDDDGDGDWDGPPEDPIWGFMVQVGAISGAKKRSRGH